MPLTARQRSITAVAGLLAGALVIMLAKAALAGPITPNVTTRSAVYQGVLSIVFDASNALEFGNAGRDIAGTGNIYIRPGGLNSGVADYAKFEKYPVDNKVAFTSPWLCLGALCANSWAQAVSYGGGGTIGGGGTQNYISKFNNAAGTSIGNSLVYENGTRINIGTTTGDSRLHVYGGQNWGSDISLEPNPADGAGGRRWLAISTNNNAGEGGGKFLIKDNNANAVRLAIDTGGNVGIGTTGPSVPLEVNVNAENLFKLINADTRSWVHKIQESNGFYVLRDDNAGADRLTIDTGGNVGIGTATPGAKLDVAGSIYWSGVAEPNNIKRAVAGVSNWLNFNVEGSGANEASIQLFRTAAGNTGNRRFRIHPGDGNDNPVFEMFVQPGAEKSIFARGNVGVGIDPVSKLHVYRGQNWGSDISLEADQSAGEGGRRWLMISTDLGAGEGPGKFLIKDNNANLVRLAIDANGNVGIGNTEPLAKLQVGGSGASGTLPTNTQLYIPGITQADGSVANSLAMGVDPNANATMAITMRSTAGNVYPIFMDIRDQNTPLVTFKSGGNVGIGTPAPATKLEVRGGLITASSAASGGNTVALGNEVNFGGPGNELSSTGDFYVTPGAGNIESARFYKKTSGANINKTVFAVSEICLNASCQTSWPAPGGSGTVGPGTVNRIAKFTAATTVDDSEIYEYQNVGVNKVNINTTTGDSSLHVYDSLQSFGADVSIEAPAASAGRRWSLISTKTGAGEGAGKLLVKDNTGGAGVRMTIDTGGNVGIGTTSPGYKLAVGGSGGGNASTNFSIGGGYFDSQWSNASRWGAGVDVSAGTVRYQTGAGNGVSTLYLYQNELMFSNGVSTGSGNNAALTERLRIDPDGDVGIAQNNPGAQLTVNNPTTAGRVGAGGDAFYAFADSSNAAISAEQVGTGFAGYFSGNVAVVTPGPSDPSQNLLVSGSTMANESYVGLRPNMMINSSYYGADFTGWSNQTPGTLARSNPAPGQGFKGTVLRWVATQAADRDWASGGAHSSPFVLSRTYRISFQYTATNSFELHDRDFNFAVVPANAGNARYYSTTYTKTQDTWGSPFFLVYFTGANTVQMDQLVIQDLTSGTLTYTLAADATGNIGVGNPAPVSKLHVFDGPSWGSDVSIEATTNNGRRWLLISTNSNAGEGAGKFLIKDNNANTVRMAIDTSGNVGIGTTGPLDRLSVAGNLGVGGAGFNSPGGTSGQGIAFPSTVNDAHKIYGEHDGGDTSNLILEQRDNAGDAVIFRNVDCCGGGTLDYMKIARNGVWYNGSGNFGIGTNNPTGAKLDVQGAVKVTNGNTITVGESNQHEITSPGDIYVWAGSGTVPNDPANRFLRIHSQEYPSASGQFYTAISPRVLCLGATCRDSWPAAGGGVGPGTQNTIAKFNNAAGNAIGDSQITEFTDVSGTTVRINDTTGFSGAKLSVHNPAGMPFTSSGSTGDAIYALANSTNAAVSAEQRGTGFAGYFSGDIRSEQGKFSLKGRNGSRAITGLVTVDAFDTGTGGTINPLVINGQGTNFVAELTVGEAITVGQSVGGGLPCDDGFFDRAVIASIVHQEELIIQAPINAAWPARCSVPGNHVWETAAVDTHLVSIQTGNDAQALTLQSGGSLGLGTPLPRARLHVGPNVGSAAINDQSLISNTANHSAHQLNAFVDANANPDASVLGLDLHNNNTTNNNWSRLAFSTYTGSTGSGNTNRNVVSAMIATRFSNRTGNNFANGDLAFFTSPGGASGISERMRILGGGNVGIGTPAPATKLEVRGGLITASSAASGGNTVALGNEVALPGAGNEISATGDFYVTPGSGNIEPARFYKKTSGVNINKTVFAVSEICLNASCQTSWPAGGGIANGTAIGQTLYWNGAAWTASSNVYNNSSQVGIRTSTPGGLVDILATDDWVTLYSSTFNIDASSPKLALFGAGGSGLQYRQISGPSFQAFTDGVGTDGAHRLAIFQHDRFIGPLGETEVVTISSTGNVGIGHNFVNDQPVNDETNNAKFVVKSYGTPQDFLNTSGQNTIAAYSASGWNGGPPSAGAAIYAEQAGAGASGTGFAGYFSGPVRIDAPAVPGPIPAAALEVTSAYGAATPAFKVTVGSGMSAADFTGSTTMYGLTVDDGTPNYPPTDRQATLRLLGGPSAGGKWGVGLYSIVDPGSTFGIAVYGKVRGGAAVSPPSRYAIFGEVEGTAGGQFAGYFIGRLAHRGTSAIGNSVGSVLSSTEMINTAEPCDDSVAPINAYSCTAAGLQCVYVVLKPAAGNPSLVRCNDVSNPVGGSRLCVCNIKDFP